MQRGIVVAIPFLWLGAMLLWPFLIVVKISLSDADIAIPPYTPHWIPGHELDALKAFDFENYLWLLEDDIYWRSILSSLRIAAIATFLTLLLSYPVAFAISQASPRHQKTLLIAVILPFWISFLIRIYAWIGILKNNGLLNSLLMSLGIIDTPIVMLNTEFAVHVGIVYAYAPFMILPIYASLQRIDNSLLEAAQDLGCPPFRVFLRVILPLSIPGIVAGGLLTFIPAFGEFVIPDLLGSTENLMIGKILWVEFFQNRDWPLASAVAVVMLCLIIPPALYYRLINQP